MPRLGRLVRTTAFKLTVIYLAVFAVLALALIAYISTTTATLIDRQTETAIDAEIRGLADVYRSDGLQGLISAVERRSVQPGAGLYLITDFAGNRIAGNIASLSAAGQPVAGNNSVIPVLYERLRAVGDQEPIKTRRALARVFVLSGSFRMLVGRDVEERIEFSHIINRALRAAVVVIVVLALLSWLFVSRRVLKRIDAMAHSGQHIVAGNMSERLPISGSGDEFDRLAESVNGMLDRIVQLSEGLREVSDNIAHDLKTPLTRIRNRIEEALRTRTTDPETTAMLEGLIAQSEAVIHTFDSLLMIARVEAGSGEIAFRMADVGEIVRDVADMYEAVAEEAGGRLEVNAPEGLFAPVDKELIRVMAANLLDNAVKYGFRGQVDPKILCEAFAAPDEVRIRVSDNGPGIPAEHRGHVVQRFVRLDRSRSQPGAGLGLSLVNAVAIHHGGTVTLSDAEPGLVVGVCLPSHHSEIGPA